MEAITGLLSSSEFLAGVGAGLVGLLAAYQFRSRVPDWALIWAGLALAVLWGSGVLGNAPSGRGPTTPALGVLAAFVVGGFAAYGLWRLREIDIAALAVLVSIGGVWATIPDTENAAVLLGVTVGLTAAWWPWRWSAPAALGAVALVAVATWVAAGGSVARTTGLVGALGSIGSLGWSAVAFAAAPRWVWLALHTISVLVWSRWAGLLESTTMALVVGVAAAVVLALAAQLFSRGRHVSAARVFPG